MIWYIKSPRGFGMVWPFGSYGSYRNIDIGKMWNARR